MISYLMKADIKPVLILLFTLLSITACTTDENIANNSSVPTTFDEFDIIADEGTTAPAINSLSWTAPAEREDNQPLSLSEIAGYRIYYGTAQGDYQNEIDVNDGSAEGYTFSDLPKGTYYIVVTTYDTDGRESLYSPEITIIV